MADLPITSLFAGGFALALVGLSLMVTLRRVKTTILLGDGDDVGLRRRIRAQANFIEYVPLGLIVLALMELRGLPVIAVLRWGRRSRSAGCYTPLACTGTPRSFADWVSWRPTPRSPVVASGLSSRPPDPVLGHAFRSGRALATGAGRLLGNAGAVLHPPRGQGFHRRSQRVGLGRHLVFDAGRHLGEDRS